MLDFSVAASYSELNNGFIIKLRLLKMPQGEAETLLEIGGALRITAGAHHFPEALDKLDGYHRCECYQVYTDENGYSPYIEASIRLYSDENAFKYREMSLGIPFGLYNASEREAYLLLTAFGAARFSLD